jgi:hypothetical protein
LLVVALAERRGQLLDLSTRIQVGLLSGCRGEGNDRQNYRDKQRPVSPWRSQLAGFYLAQRRSGHRILYFALSRLKNDSKRRFLGALDAIYQKLSMLYARRTNVLASGQVHVLGWLIGTAEVWIALRFMGIPSP